MEKYYHIAKAVAPKRQALAEAQKTLEKTLEILNAAKSKLKEVEDNVKMLEESFEASARKKAELEHNVKECEDKLTRAHKLLGALADEKDRWLKKEEELQQRLNNLVGDALIAAATIAYCGAFTPTYRTKIIKNWNKQLNAFHIPCSAVTNITAVLGDQVKTRQWTLCGLPTDNHSVENAIIISHLVDGL